MTRSYTVWCEGYQATGECQPAYCLGTIHATSFAEACAALAPKDGHFDPKRLTYWGCRLFDNEADARKSP